MNRPFQLSLLSIALPLALSVTACGHHSGPHHPSPPHVLTVVGEGEASSAPNLGTVRLGVEERAATADLAMSNASQRMAAIMSAVKGMGIADKDLQTTDLSMYFEPSNEPVYPPHPPMDTAAPSAPSAKVTGKSMEKAVEERAAAPAAPEHKPRGNYVVRNTVIVSVHDLEKLGEVIGKAMQAGANHLYGLELTVEDPKPLEQEARKRAVEHAMKKAKQLAKEANVELGPVIEVSEVGSSFPVPMMGKRSMSVAHAEAAVPVEQGQLSLTQSVQVVFSLKE